MTPGSEETLGPRLLAAKGAAGSCRWEAYLRERLPLSQWPERLRAEVVEALADRGDPHHTFERRQRLLELSSPDDPAAGASFALLEEPREHVQPLLWRLPDRSAPGAARTLFFGYASAGVEQVRWTPSGGPAYLCATRPMPDGEGRLVLPVVVDHGLEQRGRVEALDASGRALGETSFSGTFVGKREPPEWLKRLQELPVIAEGPLPDGRRWALQAGMIDNDLHHWLELKPRGGGGGGSGPPMPADEVVKLDAFGGGRDDYQHAVGQLAKHVAGAEAVLDDGSTVAATHAPAEHLPVDYFVAWAPAPRAIRRILALDEDGVRVGEAAREGPGEDLPEHLRDAIRW